MENSSKKAGISFGDSESDDEARKGHDGQYGSFMNGKYKDEPFADLVHSSFKSTIYTKSQGLSLR
jgi:hypothetical protein